MGKVLYIYYRLAFNFQMLFYYRTSVVSKMVDVASLGQDAGKQESQKINYANRDLAADLRTLSVVVLPLKKLFQEDGTPNMSYISATSAPENKLTTLGQYEARVHFHLQSGCNAQVASDVLSKLKELKEVCTELKDIKDSSVQRLDLKVKMNTNVDWIVSNATMFGSLVTGVSPLTKNLSISETPGNEADVVIQAAKTAAEKTKIAEAQLERAQERADKAFEQDAKVHEELMKEIQKLAHFKAEEATTTEVIDILRQGLASLANLKQQWLSLALFFKGLGNLIQHSMGVPLKNLVEDMQKGGNGRMTTHLKESIYGHAYDASKMTFLVNSLSSTYLKLSQGYFMPMVSELGILMTLFEQSQVALKKAELQQKAERLQGELERTLKQEKDDFERRVLKRGKELKDAFATLPLDEKQKRFIESEVKKTALASQNLDDSNDELDM